MGGQARESGGVNEEETIAHSGGPVIDSHTLWPPPPSDPLDSSCYVARLAWSLRAAEDRRASEIASTRSEGESANK